MKRTIGIIGDIGTFDYLDRNGKVVNVNGLQISDVVAQVSALPPDTKEVDVLIGTPGGNVATGKAIFTYLSSLSSRLKINMVQVDDIASIGTYIWMAGQTRLAAKGINPRTGKEYAFNVHNPWTPHVSGDAAAVAKAANSLQIEETEMAAFYQEHTGIDASGILPIMKADSWFNADKAVALKFATATYEPLQQAAYYIPMNAQEKSTLVQDFLNFLTGKTKPVAATPAPAAPAAAPAAPASPTPGAELLNKPVLIDGKPAPDFVYTVKGGVIVDVEPPDEESSEEPAMAQAPAAPAAAQAPVSFDAFLAANKEKFSDAVASTVQSALDRQKKDFEAQIVALKKQIKTPHVPETFSPETKAEDAKEFDRSLKANEHVAMKRDDPEKFKRLFYAKYGRIPNL